MQKDDPAERRGRFEAEAFDLSPTLEGGRTLRLLGWLGSDVRIGQRAVNESAHTAIEMNERF